MAILKKIFTRSLTKSCFSYLRLYSVVNVPSRKTFDKLGILNKNPLTDEFIESPYYFEDGLRKLYPYYYRHKTYCKGRWIKRKLIDVYSEEFGLFSREEFERRITKGIITVNNEPVNLDYTLKNADIVSAVVHRHELPVLACPIKILFEDDDFLVIDKPPSIPVHPCGLYRQNSVIHILANEYDLSSLYLIHRLDRLTSGVLVFTKSSEKSRDIHKEMNLRSINKEYVCRVEGNFPDGPIFCNKPIKTFYNKVGVNIVHPLGKVSITEFSKLSYNGKSSVVLCKPHTGRTHQIRVHLQFLGHPIVNDPVYNSYVFGLEKGKNGIIDKPINQLLEELLVEHSSEWGFKNPHNKQPAENRNYLNNSIFRKYYSFKDEPKKYKKDISRITFDEDCYFCSIPNQDPEQNRLGIFLHACKYQGSGWEFKADMPFWASKNWNTE